MKLLSITKRIKIQVDDVWENFSDHVGINGYDVAAYICDGVSIWPCGEMVDAKELTGIEHCSCVTCEEVREILD